MSVLVVVLTVGLIARLTRLINRDYIARHVRATVYRYVDEESDLAVLTRCPWCLSVWIGAGVATLAWFYGDTGWYQVPALAGTASLLWGLASKWFDPLVEGDL